MVDIVKMDQTGLRGASNYELWIAQGNAGTIQHYLDQINIDIATLAASSIFADTTSGLAATADGGYFIVAGSGDTWGTLYRDVAGVATLVAALPSYAGLIALSDSVIDYTSEVAITGATTLGAGALQRAHVISGTSANYTVTIPNATLYAGQAFALRVAIDATKLFTITSAGGGIDSAAISSDVMWRGESAVFYSNGTHWQRIFHKKNRFQGYMVRNVNGDAITSSFAAITLNGAGGDPTLLHLFHDSNAFKAPRKMIADFSLDAAVNVAAGTVANLDFGLGLNGSTTPISGPPTIRRFSHPATGVRNCQMVFPSVSLAAGDYIRPLVSISGGTTPTLFAGSGFATVLGFSEL